MFSLRRRAAPLGLLCALGCAGGATAPPGVPLAYTAPPPYARPAACRSVAPGEPLADLLAAASPGDAFCLAPGRHGSPLVIGAGVTVWGTRAAIVTSGGDGDTVRLVGAGAALTGVTVDGSGHRFDLQEAAVHVVAADDARVQDVEIRGALFGIIVERSRRVLVRGNQIDGGSGAQLGLRGDAIRVWETQHSRLEGNRVVGGRDVVIWYSSGNELVGNEVRGGRYGTHFMYSHDNTVTGNRYVGNVVGIFAMYSRRLRVERNLLAASTGAAGIGLGLKESSDLEVRDNAFVRDAVGIYLDNSPYEPGTSNLFSGNAVQLCDLAVAFHASTRGNRFLANRFRGNDRQVRVDGGGDALANSWQGNDFDDYAGYDFDRDGSGDVPYELRSLSGTLAAKYPQLDYLRGSPALFLIDAASHLLPLFAPKPVLVDERPWMGRDRPGDDVAP